MSAHAATLYGAHRPDLSPETANVPPTSTTSGAVERPFRELIALTSSWLEPSGLASVILMPYFLVRPSMPPTSAAEVAVAAFTAALGLPPVAAALELLELLLQPAASRMLPIAAPAATIALDERKIPP